MNTVSLLLSAVFFNKYHKYVYVKCDETSQWSRISDSEIKKMEEKQLSNLSTNIPGMYGPIYYGKLIDGKPTGYGVLLLRGLDISYRGKFKDGRFHGKGRFEYLGSSTSSQYYGYFKNGLKHGIGIEGDICGLDFKSLGFWKEDEKLDVRREKGNK